jgi:DNA polymerase I-like protein with 3'-5' exonuclease and polymerase domains
MSKTSSPTGRIRSTEPNMQNLKPPMSDGQRQIYDGIRKAFANNLRKP